MSRKLDLLRWMAGESLKAAVGRWKEIKALPKEAREFLWLLSRQRPMKIAELGKYLSLEKPRLPMPIGAHGAAWPGLGGDPCQAEGDVDSAIEEAEERLRKRGEAKFSLSTRRQR